MPPLTDTFADSATQGSREIEELVYVQCETLLHSVKRRRQYDHRLLTDMLEIDAAYQRETDTSAESAQLAAQNRSGRADVVRNITMPVVKPQIEAATAALVSTFLTGSPLFEAVSNASNAEAASELSMLLEEQAVRGLWRAELTTAFRDSLKYPLGAVEVVWESDASSLIETDITATGGKAMSKTTTKLWEGNKLRRIDPYNLIVDTRVAPERSFEDAEYIGYYSLLSFTQLIKEIQNLQNVDETRLLHAMTLASTNTTSGGVAGNITGGYYQPDVRLTSPSIDLQNSTGGVAWASAVIASKQANTLTEHHAKMFERCILYFRALPSMIETTPENIAAQLRDVPRVYKAVYVQDVLVHLELCSNAHNYLPILLLQPLADGLKYQTKPFARDLIDFQYLETAFMQQQLAVGRKALFQQVVYDPSKIASAHMNVSNPIARIPLAPAAWGTDPKQAYGQLPFDDTISQHTAQRITMVEALIEATTGINKAQRGMFVKGNKTREEYDSVMANASARVQLLALAAEAHFFTPMKHILLLNVLQYHTGQQNNSGSSEARKIDIAALRNADLRFAIADGISPVAKLANTGALRSFLQMVLQTPQLAQAFDVGGLVSHIMQLEGVDISQYAYTQEQLAQMQQQQMQMQQQAQMQQQQQQQQQAQQAPKQ